MVCENLYCGNILYIKEYLHIITTLTYFEVQYNKVIIKGTLLVIFNLFDCQLILFQQNWKMSKICTFLNYYVNIYLFAKKNYGVRLSRMNMFQNW